MPCSNAAKTRNQLKFSGVHETNETISAARWPKFAVLWGHLEDIFLLNKFFSIVDMSRSCEDIAASIQLYSPLLVEKRNIWRKKIKLEELCDGAQMAIFGDFFCILYFQRAACNTFQTCILNLHIGPHHV